ncbi:putative bifunctional diguanylate cyclase/phosphodiesterase [Kineococcus sp. SYSU DK001]|uniref:putative bifunctional diguanylate cyclase/phosphodiesterase n=1 Tax=Kineococcus sp. SYSU DK001 TaxID=3383122 RepID=UPI003D7EB054
MPAHPRRPRARGTTVALGVLAVVAALLPGASAPAADALLCAGQLTALAVLLLGRRHRLEHENPAWRWWTAAVAVLSAGSLTNLLTDLRPGPVAGVSVLVAAPAAYGAIVRWNRYRTYVTDTGDWLNGVSAALTLAAAGLLAQQRWGFLPAAWPAPQVHLWLLIVAALVTLLGTALTVAAVGGLARDVRLWIVAGGLAGLLALSTTIRDSTADALHAQAGWALACLLIAFASTLPGRAAPAPTTTQVPAAGALVVLAAAVAVLTVDGHRDGWAVTLYAGAAVLGASARIVRLARELAHLNESRRLALTDELTGVGNRRALLRALDHLADDGRPAAMLLLDVDRFKEVNDRHGHHAGDELLRRVVAVSRRVLPDDAVVTRIGGDEFAVLLPCRDEDQAVRIGRALHAAVVDDVQIGLSVGVRSAPGGALDPDRLLRQADTAMYSAKTAGGGVSVYDRDVDARLRDRAGLAADVRRLLADDERTAREVVLHYQPQVDVASGRVVGVEALVRWQHPDRGLLPPLTFLDLVEEQGLMDRLTTHVLDRATARAAAWSHRGVPLRISVNVSASSLAHPDLLRVVDGVLARHGVAPGRLVLEVTETTLMADPDVALAVAHGLTRRGVQLSIDDYGTGYSSLAYLTDLPATELKLDRAFTARVLSEPRTADVVEATVALAHRLGLRVVAEGVEDGATRAVLGGLDVDESQGYLHARPLPPEEFTRWLAAQPAQVVGAESPEA